MSECECTWPGVGGGPGNVLAAAQSIVSIRERPDGIAGLH